MALLDFLNNPALPGVIKTGKELFDLTRNAFNVDEPDPKDFALDPRKFTLDEDLYDTSLFEAEALQNIENIKTMTQYDLEFLQIAQQRLDIGLDIQIKGLQTQQSMLGMQGAAAIAAANYNNSLTAASSLRELRQLGRQMQTSLSTQRGAVASTGVSVASRGFLEIANETMSIYEDQAMQTQFETAQEMQSTTLEARVFAAQRENEARTKDFEMDVARYLVAEQKLDNQNQFERHQADIENQILFAQHNIELVNYQAGKARNKAIENLRLDRELAAQQAGRSFANAEAQADSKKKSNTLDLISGVLTKGPKLIEGISSLF